MPSVLSCPSCGRSFELPADLPGPEVRCPACGTSCDVPASSAAAPAPGVTPSPSPPPSPAEAAGDLRPCPYCGELIPAGARRCRFCDEELAADEEERPWGGPKDSRVRRDSEPHRGALVLTLGIVSLVVPYLGLAAGIAAWVMGHKDLAKMKQHAMDPSGRGTTQAGWICGIIGTIFNILVLLFCFLQIGMMVAMFSSMTPPPPPPRPLPPPAPFQPAPPQLPPR